MASSFPTSLDSFLTNINGTDNMAVKGHAAIHDDLGDAVNKIEAELGISTNRPFLNVKTHFGAKGDGATDDTSAIQAAIDALPASGGVILIPSGIYIISAPLTTSKRTHFRGAGRVATEVRVASTTNDALQISTANHSRVEGIYFQRLGGTATAGAGVNLISGGYHQIEHCAFQGFFNNISSQNANGWSIFRNYIINPVNYGILVRNVSTPDLGDSQIIGNIMDEAGTAVSAIRYESAGGLRVGLNKILHFDYGFDLAIADGATTSVVTFVGNSVESQAVQAIRLARAGTTGNFSQLAITGNQFTNTSTAHISADTGISIGTITGNIFNGAATTSIDLKGSTSSWIIEANVFNGQTTAVKLGASTVNCSTGPNLYNGVTTRLDDASFVGKGVHIPSGVALYAGSGAPNNSLGANGDVYFRSDGGAGTTIYQKRAGAWAATSA